MEATSRRVGDRRGLNSASQSFTWTVTGTLPFPVAWIRPGPWWPPRRARRPGSLPARRVNRKYSWNFGDGCGHALVEQRQREPRVLCAGHPYVVTVTARDDLGAGQLPVSCSRCTWRAHGKATASSSIAGRPGPAAERGSGREPGQQLRSRSLTRARRRASPRSRRAPCPGMSRSPPTDGFWITNSRPSTITLVDPTTLAVAGTIGLPRASQPHGIAMSPDGKTAYVALEATGQVMKYDTATLSRGDRGNVGPNPGILPCSGWNRGPGVAIHHAAAARRVHLDGVLPNGQRREDRRRAGHPQCGNARSDEDGRARAQHSARYGALGARRSKLPGARQRCRPMAHRPGCRPSGTTSCVAQRRDGLP